MREPLTVMQDFRAIFFLFFQVVGELDRTPMSNVTIFSFAEYGGRILMQTIEAIKGKDPRVRCQSLKLVTPDPTDHVKIFEFLKEMLLEIRKQFLVREIINHISPGTPAMQTVWVLMAECGFIKLPFTVVKSYRKGERKNFVFADTA